MKWFVYNMLFSLVYVAMLPTFLIRMKRRGGYRARMADRFGRYPETVVKAVAGAKPPVWVHAVSVGEVQVAGQLMRELRRIEPDLRFVLSTTSSTGWRTAERELTDHDVLIYNPLDFPCWVKRAFDALQPRAVVLAETELWPNFIREAARRKIPLFLVNARISDRSAPRYRKLRCFFGEILSSFTKIFAQSELDRDRLVAAGAPMQRIAVTGSFKFDVARRNPLKEKELRAWTGGGRILLGGSTWPGEDVFLLGVYRRLLATAPDWKLVLAPRHFEKADAVEANILAAGFTCVRRSRGDESISGAVYLADTTGELMGLYGISELVFVGKSLCAHGSQNMIEPCLCGVPTVTGPYTENFRPVMSDLLAADALIQAKDASAAEKALVRLAADPAARAALGARAIAAVERRRGTTELCAKDILSSL